MGPKKGANQKAVAAKERKTESKEKEKAVKQKQAEDADWAAAGEGAKTKAQAKKEEQAAQRAEAAAKKLEAKALAAKEEAELAAKKPQKPAANKVTSHQLQLEKEARQRERQKELEEKKRNEARVVTEDKYDELIATPNRNKTEADTLDARSVGEALSALKVDDDPEEDRHPERRAKAAFEAYQERELPFVKQEKPGLKQSQYKEMIWKAWQKAPENPFNKSRK